MTNVGMCEIFEGETEKRISDSYWCHLITLKGRLIIQCPPNVSTLSPLPGICVWVRKILEKLIK